MVHPPSRSHPRLVERLHRLNAGQRALLFISAGVVGLVLPCCGGLAAIGAVTDAPKPTLSASAKRSPAIKTQRALTTTERPQAPSPTATSPSPRVETRRTTEEQAIPFETTNVQDPSLPQGTTQVRTEGVPGSRTITYEVTLTDGVQTDKRRVAEAITREPVTKVVAVGTRKEPACDPNYSGACVPIASDVDCAGGSGDGPAYVSGPVKVIGRDIYDLDRDHDGWGCE